MKNFAARLLKFGAIGLCSLASMTATVSADEEYTKLVPAPVCPPWYFSIGAGAEVNTGLSEISPYGLINPLGAWFMQGLSDLFYALSDDIKFASVYDATFATRAEIGYYVTPGLALFGGFTYNYSSGNTFPVRQIESNELPLRVDLGFGDYTAYALRGGCKLFVPDRWLNWTKLPLRVYLTYSAGGKYVNNILIHFDNPTGLGIIDIGDYELYKSSWVFTNDLQLGLEFQITRCASIGIEAGAGFDGELRRGRQSVGINAGASSEVLDGLDFRDSGRGIYIPMTVFAKIRF